MMKRVTQQRITKRIVLREKATQPCVVETDMNLFGFVFVSKCLAEGKRRVDEEEHPHAEKCAFPRIEWKRGDPDGKCRGRQRKRGFDLKDPCARMRGGRSEVLHSWCVHTVNLRVGLGDPPSVGTPKGV